MRIYRGASVGWLEAATAGAVQGGNMIKRIPVALLGMAILSSCEQLIPTAADNAQMERDMDKMEAGQERSDAAADAAAGNALNHSE